MLDPRFIAICTLTVIVGACRPGGPARIGDGYPRQGDQIQFLDAITPAIESAGVAIERWSVEGLQQHTIQLNTEQARVFADMDDVVAVVGHAGSRDAILGGAVYNRRGVPMVVPNATSRLVAAAGPWTFPLAPNDSVQGDFIVTYAIDSLHVRRISVLYVGDEYGRGLRDGVRSALQGRRLELVDQSVIPTQGCGTSIDDNVHRAILHASLARSRPELVVLAGNWSGSWCLAQKISDADANIWIIGADGMDGTLVPPFVTRVPTRLRTVNFWTPGTDSLSHAFVSRVRSALKRNPTSAEALQYDAFMLLAAALREVGADRRQVRNWLTSLGTSRPPFVGVTGPIVFNPPRTNILRMVAPPQLTP